MCGRFTITKKDIGAIAEDLGALYEQELAAAHRPRYNVAPTQPALLARREGDKIWLREGSWGIPRSSGLQINTRAEAASTTRPCVIPADGFFEWQGPKSHRQPIWFHREDGGLLWFAGLYNEDARGTSFTILTTTPNAEVAFVHDRMPVVLDAHHAGLWLARPDRALLASLPDGALVATPVSARVNDVKNDDESCLAELRGQMKLI